MHCEKLWVTVRDGTRLAADLYLPIDASPAPVLLEALLYRKDTACRGSIPPGRRIGTVQTGIAHQPDAATFHRDGVVVARGVLGQADLELLIEAVDQNLAEPGPWASDYTPEGGSGRFFGDYVNWQRIDGYRQAALHGPLPELARTLLGETPRFFHEHTLVKERDTHEVTPWHHDEPYYCIDGAANVSLWVPLDAVPKAAGVEFIVGSHRWGRRFVPRKFVDQSAYTADANGFELVPDIESVRDQHEIVSFDMQPGDVIAFHYRTLHSAPGTAGRTATRRRAVSFRYLGSDARFATRPWLHSPPYDPIEPGQPLDDERFPLVI